MAIVVVVVSALIVLSGGSATLQAGSEDRNPSLPTMVFTTNNKAGYGNQLINLWHLMALIQCLGGDTKVVLPGVTKHKGPTVGRLAPGYLSDIGISLYDNDIILNEMGVRVSHFRSECSCFDFVLSPVDPRERIRQEGSRWNTSVYDAVEEDYRIAWRRLHITPTEQVIERDSITDDPKAYSAWDPFPKELSRLRSGRGESKCGNRVRCVFLHVYDIPDLLREMKKALPRRCSGSNIVRFKEAARKGMLPGKLLVEASRSVLPTRMKAQDTLIVHLRYESGEYAINREFCQTAHAVCLGRSGAYSIVDIHEFGRVVKQLATSLGCTHVFPILPRQFMSDELVEAVTELFGLTTDDLVSSRDLMRVNVMLFERTLAVICRGFVGETKGTSFSLTIRHQRIALGLPDVVAIESIMSKSELSLESLRSKHGTDSSAVFKAVAAAAIEVQRNEATEE
eukprot:CAMPEP_0185850864 /NCGR_PEP_ID=MMETSP1354-20130828/4834_1 /TAXON_ID=708628 /ORGANISM="Erythrolobus madagascarensis, Strain CCMP3276" /LENGTH=452 /DNA_ID=CAMNT_0028551591 /DNA_START=192 /DNA_END=1550 /DNA_ORIENTATION=+